mgnify:CR=1 FL=1
MEKKEIKILEKLVNNLWENLKIEKINIAEDHWKITLKSLINYKKINAILRVFNDIKFNVSWKFNIRENNVNLIKYLDSNKPVILFAFSKSDNKIYYLDLQHSARTSYPLSKEWYSYIKLYKTYDLDVKASLLIADHLIKYNYNWKALYKSYKKYTSSLSKIRDYFNGNNKYSKKDIESYLDQSIEVYRSLNYVYSIQDIKIFKKDKFINLINNNISWLKWLMKEEKKYWTLNDIEYFKEVKWLKLIQMSQ